MRIGDPDHLALVLEDQHVGDLRTTAKVQVLRLPNVQQVLDLCGLKFSQREIVLRAVAHDPRDPARGTTAINPRWWHQVIRRIRRNAWVVIVEDEGLRVIPVNLATYALVAGTQIAVRDVIWQQVLLMLHRLATPGPVLTMRRHDHPFLAQRVPALFPSHSLNL